MVSEQSTDVAQRALAYYDNSLRSRLEKEALHSFLAIEPDSGDYYLAETLSAAIQAARAAHPDRLAFALRIGHPTAVHLGAIAL